MNKKIYLIQPTYRNPEGKLYKGKSLIYGSLALPALSATIPADWEKEFCIEYYDDVNYETNASVIGISSMGYDILHGTEIAQEFKKRGKTVIFGGTQAHFSATRICSYCDSIVYGNPSPRDMSEILTDALKGQLAREYRCGQDINYPFDYSVLANKRMRFTPVLTSVGCKENCDFCCTAAICDGRYRLRKLSYVLTDLKNARRKSKHIVFGDSNIYNNGEYLNRLCTRMVEESMHLRWGAQCTIDIGDDPNLLRLLKRSGCLVLLVGLETLNQKNMDGVGKRMHVRLHRDRIARIRDAGIAVGGYFVLGFDDDTAESFHELSDFIRETGIALPILNILLPAPGTRIYDRLKNEGRLLIRNEEDFLQNNARYATASSHCFYNPRRMTADETEREFLTLYRDLTTCWQIARRSIHPHPFTAAMLMYLNWEMRKEYRAMVTANVSEGGRIPLPQLAT